MTNATATQTKKADRYLGALMATMAAIVALCALSAHASAEQGADLQQSVSGSAKKDAALATTSTTSTTPKASFASGSGANFLGVKVSDHGNLMSFESPAGQEQVFDGREGYALCSIGVGDSATVPRLGQQRYSPVMLWLGARHADPVRGSRHARALRSRRPQRRPVQDRRVRVRAHVGAYRDRSLGRGETLRPFFMASFTQRRRRPILGSRHSPCSLPVSLRCSWPRRIGPLLRPRVAPMQLDRV